MINTDIHLIVVSYWSSNSLRELVDSVIAQSSSSWKLTIVDNSESVEEVSALLAIAEADPRIELVVAEENLGYLGGARLAERRVAGTDARWTIVSNADITVPSADFFSALLALDCDGVGLIAPKIVSARTGADQNPFMFERPTLADMRRRRKRMQTPTQAQITALLSKARRRAITLVGRLQSPPRSCTEVYAAHGSFLVLSRRFFALGGTLDHPIFLFGEELTLAERARALGLKVQYRPELSVCHVEHGQMGIVRSRFVLREMVRAAAYGEELFTPRENA